MKQNNIALLDCTLRDGGYINDWAWGFQRAREIIRALVRAGVDTVEVGFLRNVDGYDPNRTVCNRIEELNRLLPERSEKTMFSAMAMRSNYDIEKLRPYSGEGVEMIRVTAHDYDIREGMDFARQVKERGYKLSINPINIMGYTDKQILWILEQVNEITPYQFSIVDTFGSMKRRDLERIVGLVDNNLDRGIRVALHLHENMSLSSSLAQSFIDHHLNRPVAVDASLMGMGRTPGNLPIELIADYLNDYCEGTYEIDDLMDAIQDHIAPIKGENQWGYSPAYFLSARFNLHRNYAEFYLSKGDLTHRDINHLLAQIDPSKATAFDASYAEELYKVYIDNRIDDGAARVALRAALTGKTILLIAPGSSLETYASEIGAFMQRENPTVISVNFIPEGMPVDYAFFSNNKRFSQLEEASCKVIATSNLSGRGIDYRINYNSLSGAFDQGCNSLIMLLKLLKEMDVKRIVAAGADGYTVGGRNYCLPSMRNYTEHGPSFNRAVARAIRSLQVDLRFLTPSAYEEG